MAFRWALRANAKDLDAAHFGGNTVLASAGPEPRVLMPTPEEEVLSIVRRQRKQLVLLIQAKGKGNKVFRFKAVVDTVDKLTSLRRGLSQTWPHPAKRP